MNREMLDYVIKQNNYLEGGTKEACIKVREFILHSQTAGSEVSASHSCVTAEEFVASVKILLAAAFSNDDEIPETWHCDSDCKFISAPFCKGEFNAKQCSTALCPYFMDEGLA